MADKKQPESEPAEEPAFLEKLQGSGRYGVWSGPARSTMGQDLIQAMIMAETEKTKFHHGGESPLTEEEIEEWLYPGREFIRATSL